jgi:hypothetical protein
MGVVSTTLQQEAESIFTDLGYDVATDGSGLRAKRKWRTVDVTPMDEPEDPPASGGLRCFVTWSDRVDALERRLDDAQPEYEWAIIGVSDEDYVVSRCPSGHGPT